MKETLPANRNPRLMLLARCLMAAALTAGWFRVQAGTPAKLTIQPEKGDKLDSIQLTWDAQPGAVYRVQSTSSLGATQNWQTIEPVVADGTNAHLEVLAPPGASNSAMFYRLQAQPEIFSLEPTFVDSSDTNAVLYLLGQLLPTNGIVVINGIQFLPSIIDSNGVWASIRLNGLPPGVPITGKVSVLDPGTSNVLAEYKLQSGFIYATQPPTSQLQGPPGNPPGGPTPVTGTKIGKSRSNIQNNRITKSRSNIQNNRTRGISDPDEDCDGVSPATGEFRCAETDLVTPGRGLDFVWTRTYRSRTGPATAQGNGWDFSYNVSLTAQADGTLLLRPGNGRADTFYPNGTGGWARDEYFVEVRDLNQDGSPDVLFADGGQWLFNPALPGMPGGGKLSQIVDRNGNTISLYYDTEDRCDHIVDTLGRTNVIAYDSASRVASLTDFSGRIVRYEYDLNGDLTACVSPPVTGTPNGNDFPGGKTNHYAYSSGYPDERLNHNLISMTDAKGQTWLQVIYQTINNPAAPDFDAVDFVQRGPYRESLRRFPQPPTPANQFAVMKSITCDSLGNVTECLYDSRLRCVRRLDYTGRANPALPVTETSNRPTGQLRPEDPPYFETQWTWNDDSLCTMAALGDGFGRINRVRLVYDRQLNPAGSPRKKGDVRVVREFACCNGADTDGDGVNDLMERAWHFDYDPNFGSPMLGFKQYDPAKQYLAGDTALDNTGLYQARGGLSRHGMNDSGFIDGRRWEKVDNSDSAVSNVRTRINQLENVLINHGLLARSSGENPEVGIGTDAPMPDGFIAVPDRVSRKLVFVSHKASNEKSLLVSFCLRATDPRGLITTCAYDANGNRTRWKHHDIHGLDAPTMEFSYNSHGQLTGITNAADANGYRRVDALNYYPSGPQAGYCSDWTVDAQGPVVTITRYEYDVNGNLSRIVDPRGNDRKFHNNGLNQLVRLESATNLTARCVTDYYYDENDNVQQAIVELRDDTDVKQGTQATLYAYDLLDRPFSVTEQVSAARVVTTEYVYNGNGECILVRTPLAVSGTDPNNVTLSEYDERGLLFRASSAPGTGHAPTNQWSYTAKGSPATKQYVDDTASAGLRITHYDYDGFGRCVSTTDPAGNVRLSYFDRNDNLVRARVYAEANDVPGGAGNARLREWSWKYDSQDRCIESRGSHFDPATQQPIGDGASITTFTYAPNGACLSVTDDNNHITRYSYDTQGRVAAITDPKLNVVSFTYDECDNRLSELQSDRSDLTPGIQQFSILRTFDKLHRLTRSVDNAGNTNRYAYDSFGQCVRATDPKGQVSFTEYDLLGRVLTEGRDLDGDGVFNRAVDVDHTYAYDDNSRLIGHTDDNTNTTTYAYDSQNRCASVLNADGTHCSLIWSPRSNLLLRQDPNGSVVSNSFDLLDRCISRSVTPGPTVAATTTFEIFAYDGLSRCVAATNNVSFWIQARDSFGNCTHSTQDGLVTTYTYDGAGNCLTLAYPSGLVVTYGYNALDAVTNVSTSKGGPPMTAAQFDYEGPHRLGRISRANGINTRIAWDGYVNPPNPSADFGWQQISAMNHQAAGGGAIIDRRVFTYDRNQNKILRARTAPFYLGGGLLTNGFAYDGLDRLVHGNTTDGASVQDVSYSLDGNGNRQNVLSNGLVGLYFMDATLPTPADFQMNQYSFAPAGAQSFDENGNLVSRSTTLQQLQYVYDYADRLVAVNDLSQGFPTPLVSFTYDALGRRISKTVHPNQPPFAPVTTQYVLGKEGHRVHELRRANAVVATFVPDGTGSAKDEMIMLKREGHDYYFHNDELGNVVALTDAGGSVVERYEYDNFGMPQFLTPDGFPVATNSSPLGNPFLFQGMEWDAETGLYATSRRYTGDSHICTAGKSRVYDPATGRYILRAGVPLRFTSACDFAGNNPWSGGGPGSAAKGTRSDLKEKFQNGDIPDPQDFAEVLDSYIHKTDDGVTFGRSLKLQPLGGGIPLSGKVARNVLKSFFEKGDKPTQAQFNALIDSAVHLTEDRDLIGLNSHSVEKFHVRQEFGPQQMQKKQ